MISQQSQLQEQHNKCFQHKKALAETTKLAMRFCHISHKYVDHLSAWGVGQTFSAVVLFDDTVAPRSLC